MLSKRNNYINPLYRRQWRDDEASPSSQKENAEKMRKNEEQKESQRFKKEDKTQRISEIK